MGPFDIPSPKGSRLVLSRRVPIWNGEAPERIAVFLESVARSFFKGGAEFFATFTHMCEVASALWCRAEDFKRERRVNETNLVDVSPHKKRAPRDQAYPLHI